MQLLTAEQISAIAAECMTDYAPVPVEIGVPEAWMLVTGMDLALKYPGYGDALRLSLAAATEQFRNAMIQRNPEVKRLLGDQHGLDVEAFTAASQPIMRDTVPLSVLVTYCDLWLVISALQLTVRHPDLPEMLGNALVAIAGFFEAALTQKHPDAALIIAMGWNTAFDVEQGRDVRHSH